MASRRDFRLGHFFGHRKSALSTPRHELLAATGLKVGPSLLVSLQLPTPDAFLSCEETGETGCRGECLSSGCWNTLRHSNNGLHKSPLILVGCAET